MCGIVGFLDFARSLSDSDKIIRGMTNRLRHRGPDGEHCWTDRENGVALGHTRLAVLDLTDAGRQPMISACGRYLISFNGEIYNFAEIRSRLEREGSAPVWRGHSDTEVLLAAVSAWGFSDSLLLQLNGMFAFALWDREEKRLHLARDRMGEKPLYYGWLGGIFVFCSELKVLRGFPGWQGQVDPDALACLMRHGYIAAPLSIFTGISKLPAACSMFVDLERPKRESASYCYWRPSVGADMSWDGGQSEDAWLSEAERLLAKSVSLRMVADVPVGAFLSGGIDSSLIAAQMQAHSSRPIKTFTIGFHEEGYDEAENARAVAHHLGTDHTELYISAKEAMDVVPQLHELYDEPFADPSQIPACLLARLARSQVKVTLTGDGGDELFYGYSRYPATSRLWARLRAVPRPVRIIAEVVLRHAPTTLLDKSLSWLSPQLGGFGRMHSVGDRLKKLDGLLSASSARQLYSAMISAWNVPPVLGRTTSDSGPYQCGSAPLSLPNLERWMAETDMRIYLPDDILVKVDRSTMAVGLESRVPLLDSDFVDFARRVPHALKWRDGKGKWLLRQLLAQRVPERLFDRPKQGFSVPIGAWLRGPLREWAEDLLNEQAMKQAGYLDVGPVRKRWQEHLSGKRNWQYALWNVLIFQSWLRGQGND